METKRPVGMAFPSAETNPSRVSAVATLGSGQKKKGCGGPVSRLALRRVRLFLRATEGGSEETTLSGWPGTAKAIAAE